MTTISGRAPGQGAGAMPPVTVEALVREVRDLPALPAVVLELLASIDHPDLDLHALGTKIAIDQALTAKTLRLANSSFYGMPGTITTIPQAIAVLGLHSMRTLITACVITGSFEHGGALDLQMFWRHAVGTAVCARQLAPHLQQHPETAFTAGLLHDIGSLVLATRFPQHYMRVLDYRRQHDCGPGQAELAIFGFDHALAGSVLATHWKFPQLMREAVGGHHAAAYHGAKDAQPAAIDPMQPDKPSLALLVQAADIFAHALDLAGEEDGQVPPVSQAMWDALALSPADCTRLFHAMETSYADICRILVA